MNKLSFEDALRQARLGHTIKSSGGWTYQLLDKRFQKALLDSEIVQWFPVIAIDVDEIMRDWVVNTEERMQYIELDLPSELDEALPVDPRHGENHSAFTWTQVMELAQSAVKSMDCMFADYREAFQHNLVVINGGK